MFISDCHLTLHSSLGSHKKLYVTHYSLCCSTHSDLLPTTLILKMSYSFSPQMWRFPFVPVLSRKRKTEMYPFLKGNFSPCCYLPLPVQALSLCTSCHVLAMPACWQVNERSHRSSCFFPGDTPCPHSVTIKSRTRCRETSKTVHYGLPGGAQPDTIKEWYRLQIMHVSSLIRILSKRNRTVQRCTDAPQRPCMLNIALTHANQGHLLTRELLRRGFRQGLAT